METTAIERAVRKVGGQRAMATRLGLTQQAVGGWVSRGQVPAERVLQVEAMSGVSRHELRPDLYPHDPLPAVVSSEAGA